MIDSSLNQPTRQSVVPFAIVFSLLFAPVGYAQGQGLVRNVDIPLPNVNETKVSSLNIRKIVGEHLVLYTDLPSTAAIDELPRVFDAAIPSWCAYFGIPEQGLRRWKMIGSLMREKERFIQAGLLPTDLPPFANGYQRGSQIWWYEQHEQPSDYYRRHLMLHEGTHGFMEAKLRGAGPPWYMEGTAELLATHRWQNNQLTLNYFPQDKSEVPLWGRIKIVRDEFRAGTPKSLAEIMNYDTRAHLQVNAYGWCWAASAFFDANPRYRRRFRDLQKNVRDNTSSFSERFLESFSDEEKLAVNRQWQLFTSQLDYGYDIAREAVEVKPTRPFTRGKAKVTFVADRGWQSSGLHLEAGKNSYRITATGRYQLATQPKVWWCEPNGITIEYYQGRPLGIVLAAVVDEARDDRATNGFLSPRVIGAETNLTGLDSGTLYFRVNDAPSKLADNRGEITVVIESL